MISIVKHQAVIALLVTILSNFSDCDYCPASAPTVSVVSKCPTNKTEWDQAASRKKCSHMSAKCGDKSPVYHCLLNQWGNETVEVCASTWYISGFCAIYNTDEMKVIDNFERDCTAFSEGKCPPRYISSEAYLYQKCYMQESSNTIPLPDRPIGTEETNDCIMSSVIAIVVTVLVLAITSLVVFITLRLKISKKAPDETAPDVECMPLCNASRQIVEEGETLLGENVNEENRVNPTKKTAESSSCGDSVESEQKPETAETCDVDYSKLRPVDYLRSQYEDGKTGNQTPNESVTNSSIAKPQDKENTVPKGLFQKEDGKTGNQTPNESVTNSSIAKPKDKENTVPKGLFQKEGGKAGNQTPNESVTNSSNAKPKDKENTVQKEVEPKVEHTTKNINEFSSRKNLNNEENTDKDPAAEKGNAVQKEREKLPNPTPGERGIKAPSPKAKDTENAAENKDNQTIDHTSKNDVEFSSHGNPYNKENEDVNTQSPDSTLRESVKNTTNAKSTGIIKEDDKKVGHTTKNDVEFSSHGNPTDEEHEDVNTQSPDSTLGESVKNTTDAKSTEFKQNADNTHNGGGATGGIVLNRKKRFEEMTLNPERR